MRNRAEYFQQTPSPSSPYYLFGIQHRYPFAWTGGVGGVLPPTHPVASSLGGADLYESGYGDPNWIHYPAFNRTILHRGALGDTPFVRTDGPEPLVPGDGGEPMGLSDSETKLALVAAAGLAAWWVFFRKQSRRRARARGRRNPSRGYYVISKTRGVTGAILLKSKREAKAYANYLRRAGQPARIKKR